ncbi:TMEM175 family protein [soil metagenome]
MASAHEEPKIGKGRLEAFSDGVIAIIITIMVLELKVPHGTDLEALTELVGVFLSYVLSFTFVGLYWNNHHHMLAAVERISGRVLWANLHLLFWLSLIPFVTGWIGENHLASVPVALYGVVLFMASVAYTILAYALIAANGKDCALARAMGRDYKGKASSILYLAAIGVSFFSPAVAISFYVAVALLWVIPDPRIVKTLPTRNPS